MQDLMLATRIEIAGRFDAMAALPPKSAQIQGMNK